MNKREQLLIDGYRPYKKGRLTVYWNPDICDNVGECYRKNSKVFDHTRRPWMDLDQGTEEEIFDACASCPTGALKAYWDEPKKY